MKLTGRKVERVGGVRAAAPDARAVCVLDVALEPVLARDRSPSEMRVIVGMAGAIAGGGRFPGVPGGIAPADNPLGGGGAGGMEVGGSAGFGGAGVAAACWAEVSRCSSSAKRCRVFASKAWRSLLSRACSSRSVSYWASLRPAVPTHWSTGLTWPPGGMTPMLVTVPGCPAAVRASPFLALEPVTAKISQRMPTPPATMAPSIAYWRCLGDRRSSRARRAWAGWRGAFIAHLRAGSRRRWCSRRGAGCGARWRFRRPLRRRDQTPAPPPPWVRCRRSAAGTSRR